MLGKAVSGAPGTGRLEVVDQHRNIQRRMDVDQQMDVIGFPTKFDQFAVPSYQAVRERLFEVRQHFGRERFAPVSQECGQCGHIHKDNRVSQSEFVCQSCGHTDHADHNAAKVIAWRGVRQLLAGKGIKKEKKTCRITRQKVGAEGSEPGAEMRPTLGETAVSRLGGNTLALWSLTQETPAIALA